MQILTIMTLFLGKFIQTAHNCMITWLSARAALILRVIINCLIDRIIDCLSYLVT